MIYFLKNLTLVPDRQRTSYGSQISHVTNSNTVDTRGFLVDQTITYTEDIQHTSQVSKIVSGEGENAIVEKGETTYKHSATIKGAVKTTAGIFYDEIAETRIKEEGETLKTETRVKRDLSVGSQRGIASLAGGTTSLILSKGFSIY